MLDTVPTANDYKIMFEIFEGGEDYAIKKCKQILAPDKVEGKIIRYTGKRVTVSLLL